MVRFSDDGTVLRSFDSGIVELIDTINSWSELCKERATKHAFRAFICRAYSYTLTAVGICCSGAATVLYAMTSTDTTITNPLYIYSASLSGVGTVVYALMNIIDPSGLRISHLNATRDYDLLGREIDVWVKTERNQDDFDSWRMEAVRLQRRVDNIQSVAPSL